MGTMGDSYSSLYAEFYDELLEGELDDLPFWESFLRDNPGRALEVGCGTGRILLPLLKQGLEVCGIDNSRMMVKQLVEKADADQIEVSVKVQGMEELNFEGHFQSIFIPGFSIQLLSDRSLMMAALKRFHEHLVEGGLLALSVFFPWEEMDEDEEGEWRLRKRVMRPDGTLLENFQSVEIDMTDQTFKVLNRYELFDGGANLLKKEQVDICMLWFYPHEFDLMFAEAGFELVDMYSDNEDGVIDESTAEVIYVVQKR